MGHDREGVLTRLTVAAGNHAMLACYKQGRNFGSTMLHATFYLPKIAPCYFLQFIKNFIMSESRGRWSSHEISRGLHLIFPSYSNLLSGMCRALPPINWLEFFHDIWAPPTSDWALMKSLRGHFQLFHLCVILSQHVTAWRLSSTVNSL